MTDPMMKKIMIHGAESFKFFIGEKYQFLLEHYEQINEDMQEWKEAEFKEVKA